MKNKKYYIAYGSNLSVEQMADRCPDAKIAGQAVLAGWELLFRGCATIAPNPKKNTPVLVWEISERDEGNLDLYEGYPNYYRKEDLNIELLRERAEPEMVTAMVYIMENDFGRRSPSRYYYKVLHDGYKAFHFPMHILEGALKECMGNAEERAFIAGDGVGKPLGLLAETGGAKVGVTAAQKDAVTFDEIFKLYYALKAPYRKKAQFLCNEALVLQLMTIKDNNGNYIWKPGLEIGKPDTLLNRPLKTSAFMPEIKGGSKVMAFGDYSYYWVADRQNRTFRRLNELYARTDQVGFLTTQRVDGKLILPEAVQLLQMAPQG